MKPTQEQVIAWYEQANGWSPEGWDKTVQELERFAALAYEAGRKDENEACAQICDEQMAWGEINKSMAVAAGNCADLIRERREQ